MASNLEDRCKYIAYKLNKQFEMERMSKAALDIAIALLKKAINELKDENVELRNEKDCLEYRNAELKRKVNQLEFELNKLINQQAWTITYTNEIKCTNG